MVLYIAYLPDKLWMNTPVKVYNILQQTEIIVSFQHFLRNFPPPPLFAIRDTPTSHLFHYANQLKWTRVLNEYKDLTDKNIVYKLLSKL